MKEQVENGIVILTLSQFQTRLAARTLKKGYTYKIKGKAAQSVKIGSTTYTADDSGIITITLDSTPTASSTNAVTSGGVYTALSGKEDVSNKVTSLSSASTNDQYPGAKLVYDTTEDIREVAAGKTKSYIMSDVTNPVLNSQSESINITSSLTDIDGNVITLDDFKQGDNIYVQQTDVPDRWCSAKKYIAPAADTNGSTTYTGTPTPDSPVTFSNTTLKDVDNDDVELRGASSSIYDTYASSSTLITRNVGVKILRSTDEVNYGSYGSTNFHISLTNGAVLCTHFGTGSDWATLNNYQIVSRGTAKQVFIRYDELIGDTTAESVQNFKNWVEAQYTAGTPVTIYYELETATTETETLYQTSSTGLVTLYKLETAKVPVLDVQLNGTSAVSSNIANITTGNGLSSSNGSLYINTYEVGLTFEYGTHKLKLQQTPDSYITGRTSSWQSSQTAIMCSQTDLAVKSAMCDGLGTAWTTTEQSAAQTRMGIEEYTSAEIDTLWEAN